MSEGEIDALLAEFRQWLHSAVAQASAEEIPEPAQAVDLHTLVSQFVALKQEVNLQTRATRAQQEQNAETLQRLGEALEALHDRGATDTVEQEQARPLLKAMVDASDALSLARREVQRVQESLVPALDQVVKPAPQPGFWRRLFGSRKEPPRPPAEAQEALERIRKLLDSVVIGYTMSLQRLERMLEQHGLEPIAAIGEPFDPETMEVVEVVHETTRASTEVIAEVRRGYLWQGRVFRFAQVRVARPAP